MKNYYALVAGMPDVSADDTKLGFTVADFKTDYLPQLSAHDRKLAALFFLKYDHRNLLAYLEKGDNAGFDPRGLYSREELAEAVAQVKADEEKGRTLPPYFYRFIADWPALKETEEGPLPEDVLATAYYGYAAEADNRFVREWFEFSRHTGNILTALTARKYGFPAGPRLVGGGEITEALATSGSRDFGIGTEIDYLDALIRIHETADPVERERKLDLLKWEWLEEHTFFCHFSVERLLALLLKLDIVERWAGIDGERGRNVFRSLVERLRKEAEIPEEFKK